MSLIPALVLELLKFFGGISPGGIGLRSFSSISHHLHHIASYLDACLKLLKDLKGLVFEICFIVNSLEIWGGEGRGGGREEGTIWSLHKRI